MKPRILSKKSDFVSGEIIKLGKDDRYNDRIRMELLNE